MRWIKKWRMKASNCKCVLSRLRTRYMVKKINYTARLEKIAKKNRMLEMNKVKPFLCTAKEVRRELPKIKQYYSGIGAPISMIIGDEYAINELRRLCPDLKHIKTCSFKSRMDELDFDQIKVVEIQGLIFVACTGITQSWDLEAMLYNYRPCGRTCNIYEYLAMKGVNARTVFYRYCHFSFTPAGFLRGALHFLYHIASYKVVREVMFFFCKKNKKYSFFPWYGDAARQEIFCTKKTLAIVSDDVEKAFYIEKMMGLCIRDRDILDLQEYIKEYLELRFVRNEKVARFNEQLELLLSEMQEGICRNRNDDIFLHWIDAVSNDRLKNMPFVYGLANQTDSNKSDWAYTCMPYTTWTMKTMFSGLRPVEGRLFESGESIEDYYLMNELREKGYDFKYFGPKYIQEKLIHKREAGVRRSKIRSLLSTAYLWEALNYIACGGGAKWRERYFYISSYYV